jgi:hypothetical protein
VTVEFAPPNEFGVLDHVVHLRSDEAVYNPMRVWVGESQCKVVFTLWRRPVAADLATLKRRVAERSVACCSS